MPENVFRLLVVGLLFLVVSMTADNVVIGGINWALGSGFVIFGFISWIDERKASQT